MPITGGYVLTARVRHFIAIAEAGSIGAAARRLALSQPALTKSLRALEAEVQVPLFQRTSKGMRLTRYGKVLYGRARSATTELIKAEEELRALAGGRTASVAFGFGPIAAKHVVPEVVSAFVSQFPDASVRLMEGFVHQLIPLVRDETLDFCIGPGLPEFRSDHALKFRPLFHYQRVIAARRGHPLGRSGSLRELTAAQWLSFEPQGTLEQLFARLEVSSPPPVVQSDSAAASIELIVASDMLGILPGPMLSADPRIASINVREPLPPFTVGMFVRADSPLTRAALAMSKLVTDVGRRVATLRHR
jgi:DNA-binding transcriptional LysR family regulator